MGSTVVVEVDDPLFAARIDPGKLAALKSLAKSPDSLPVRSGGRREEQFDAVPCPSVQDELSTFQTREEVDLDAVQPNDLTLGLLGIGNSTASRPPLVLCGCPLDMLPCPPEPSRHPGPCSVTIRQAILRPDRRRASSIPGIPRGPGVMLEVPRTRFLSSSGLGGSAGGRRPGRPKVGATSCSPGWLRSCVAAQDLRPASQKSHMSQKSPGHETSNRE
jgi:hypothetical protein